MARSQHDGKSRKDKLRQERQEALREQLSKQGHLQHVVELLDETSKLTPGEESEFIMKRNDLVIKHKLSLIKKYIPDLSNLAVQADVEQKTILIDLSGGKLDKATDDE